MNRSRRLGGLRRVGLVAVLVSALGLSSCSSADSVGVDELIQLCGQVDDVVADELGATNESEMIADSRPSGNGKTLVSCVPAPSPQVDVGDSTIWVNLSIIFHLDAEAGFPENDYCETEGVFNQPTNTFASESREFSGRPYCFSWGTSSSGSSIYSSYVDHKRDTTIVISWRVTEYVGSIYDKSDELGALVLAANDTLLTSIHDGFESAGSADLSDALRGSGYAEAKIESQTGPLLLSDYRAFW